MAENIKDCPWAVEMYGTYVCRLNIIPCERVPKNLCDKEEKSGIKANEEHQ